MNSNLQTISQEALELERAGDLAVLSYNLGTYVAAEHGGEKLLRAWNATEVYRRIAGAWRIVHSNWAITQSMTTASVS